MKHEIFADEIGELIDVEIHAYNDGDTVVHFAAGEGDPDDPEHPEDVTFSGTVQAPDSLYDTGGKWDVAIYTYNADRGMHDLYESHRTESKADAIEFINATVGEIDD